MLIAQAPADHPAIVREISCPVVTQMIKYGAENPVRDVSNLQMVLRDREHMDVFVNGDYDEQTLYAVIAFQQKYASETLAPYGRGAQPTGIVSLTTAKKLDQVACDTPLTLNERELKFISIVGEKAMKGIALQPEVKTTYNILSPQDSDDSGVGLEDPQAPTYYPYFGDEMTASAAGASTMQRFGAYIRGLFR